MKDRMAAERAAEERKSYHRLSALNGNLMVLYYVDPESNEYTEFNASAGYQDFDITKEEKDFFQSTYENSLRTIHPDDLALFHSQVTKENILATIERDGVFLLNYRMMKGDLPSYVRLKAAKIVENGKPLLIIGLLDEDAQTRQEQEYARSLSVARKMATIDSLTGVKNKHSYVQWEEKINAKINHSDQEPFAVVVCDINNLKAVNDLYGHKEGDVCIKKACARICAIFSHSSVFRIGGDEFVVLLSGDDYDRREKLMEQVNEIPKDPSKRRIGETISAGMVEYRKNQHFSLLSVFEEADRAMYERKQFVKGSYLSADTMAEGLSLTTQEMTEKYEFQPDEKAALASLQVPFAVYQFINRHVVTLVLSDGFCDLFGYEDRLMAYLDMDHDMYKDTHPDDVERISAEAFRFATEGGTFDVTYRTKVPGSQNYHKVHAVGKHVLTNTGAQIAHVWYTEIP